MRVKRGWHDGNGTSDLQVIFGRPKVGAAEVCEGIEF